MKQLVTAGKQLDQMMVPVPKGFADMVTDKLEELVDAEDSDIFTKDGSPMAATPKSKSSVEHPASRRRVSQRKPRRRILHWATRTPPLLTSDKGAICGVHVPEHQQREEEGDTAQSQPNQV